MRTILILQLIIFSLNIYGQDLNWGKSINGSGFSTTLDMVIDNNNEIYITGYFKDTLDLNPSLDTFNLMSNGAEDVFIAKYDNQGEFIWGKSFGGSDDDRAMAIAVDDDGNIYTTGYFNQTVNFNPSGIANTGVSAGFSDIFITKHDVNGDLLWKRTYGSNGINTIFESGQGIAIDHDNNIITTGSFRKTINFDPGNSNFSLTSEGDADGFILSLDANGNFNYCKSISGVNAVAPKTINIDLQGNIHIGGTFAVDETDFDPSANTFHITPVGGWDSFIGKYDNNANFIWAKSFGGVTGVYLKSVVVDEIGNVYASGNYNGTIDFDPSTNVNNLTQTGNSNDDIFISKLDINGSFVWAKSINGNQSSGYANCNSITVDNSNNIYLTGSFDGSFDFDPSSNDTIINGLGGDIFLLKLDSSGFYKDVNTFSSGQYNRGQSIAISQNNDLLITGSFGGSVDFDLSASQMNLIGPNTNNHDIFLVKYYLQDNTTALSNIRSELDKLTVYPNPVKNLLFVKSESKYVSYEIFNQLGQPIKHGELNDNRINIKELSSGLYNISLYDTQNNVITKKIIVSP